jgi:hypothetical protein
MRGACGKWPLVVRRRYLIAVPRPLPAAPLVACLRYLIVVLRPLPRRASQVLDGAQVNAIGAQVTLPCHLWYIETKDLCFLKTKGNVSAPAHTRSEVRRKKGRKYVVTEVTNFAQITPHGCG